MPKPYPKEFRDDVVRVAENRQEGVTLEQVAEDFGIHPMTLSNWLRQRRSTPANSRGVTTTETAENRELKQRIRLLEQENEVLRRAAAYLSQANLPGKGDLPARARARRRRDPRHGVVSGTRTCRQHYYRWLDSPFTDALLDEAYLANAIFDAHRR